MWRCIDCLQWNRWLKWSRIPWITKKRPKKKRWGISLCVESPSLHLLCQEAITVSGCSSFYQAEEIIFSKVVLCHDGVSMGMRLCPAVLIRIHLHGHQQTCVRARWGLEWVATRFDGMWWPCPKKGGLVWESLHILSLNLRSCQDAVNLGSTSKKVGTFFCLNLAPLLADHAFRIWLLAKEDFISKWQDLSRS